MQPGHLLTEVRLDDKNGKSAGNIDLVLVAYDSNGRILDFGALEVQAVYISRNVRKPFEHYMQDPARRRQHGLERPMLTTPIPITFHPRGNG